MRRGVELEERDFFQNRFTEKELRDLIGTLSASEVFSWNSPSFKKLGHNRADLNDNTLINLMLKEPRLIRRPLVQVGDRLIVGLANASMAQIVT